MVTEKPLLARVVLGTIPNKTFDPLAGVKEFNLTGIDIDATNEGQAAKFTLYIEDSGAALYPLLRNWQEVDVWFGKTAWTKQFTGLIAKKRTIQSGPDKFRYELFGYDLTVRPTKRVINYQRFQKKQADGVTQDLTDTSTEIGQMVLDILTRPDSYPSASSFDTIEATDLVGYDIDDTGITLPSFVAPFKFASDAFGELAVQGGRVWWIDENGIFKFKSPAAIDSGILVTDDLSTGGSWGDQTKVAYITYPPDLVVEDDGTDQVTRWYGIGGDDLAAIDIGPKSAGETTTATAGGSDDLDSLYRAVQFTPNQAKLGYAAVYVKKVGTVTVSLDGEIRQDIAGVPGGLVKAFSVPADQVGTSGGWIIGDIGADTIQKGTLYWVILVKKGTAGNTFSWYHDGGAAGTYATSSDGVAWTAFGSAKKYAIRTYAAPPVVVVDEDAEARLNYNLSEGVVSNPQIRDRGTMSNLVTANAALSGKIKKLMTVRVYPPDVLPKVGQSVTVHTGKTALNEFFQVTGVHYTIETQEEQMGAFSMELRMVELF